MESYLKQIYEATEYIQSNSKIEPQIGIVLGTGLGGRVLPRSWRY